METKSIGFLPEKELAEVSAEDYIFGVGEELAGITDEVKMTVGAVYAWPNPVNGIYQRIMNTLNHAVALISEFAKKYLPIGQIQRGREDWMNCATNAPCNLYETHFNYALDQNLISPAGVKWLKQKGYINDGRFEVSNAFNSILSGTTRQGNSLKAPFESIRKDGLIPLSLLPDDKSMNWSQYHNTNRITQEMRDLGKEFLERFMLNYEKVPYNQMGAYLGFKWWVFDSYPDVVDNDHIKQLAPNYNMLNYSYRGTINELKKNPLPEEEGENMKLYKVLGKPEVYLLGKGDSLYHHLRDEAEVIAIFGSNYSELIEEVSDIPASQVGFPLRSRNNFVADIIALLTNFKGRR